MAAIATRRYDAADWDRTMETPISDIMSTVLPGLDRRVRTHLPRNQSHSPSVRNAKALTIAAVSSCS